MEADLVEYYLRRARFNVTRKCTDRDDFPGGIHPSLKGRGTRPREELTESIKRKNEKGRRGVGLSMNSTATYPRNLT